MVARIEKNHLLFIIHRLQFIGKTITINNHLTIHGRMNFSTMRSSSFFAEKSSKGLTVAWVSSNFGSWRLMIGSDIIQRWLNASWTLTMCPCWRAKSLQSILLCTKGIGILSNQIRKCKASLTSKPCDKIQEEFRSIDQDQSHHCPWLPDTNDRNHDEQSE